MSDNLAGPSTLPDVCHTPFIHVLPLHQLTSSGDVERTPHLKDEHRPDPYKFRQGIMPDDELNQLRRRHKTGKNLEQYHRKQNQVRVVIVAIHMSSDAAPCSFKLIASLLKTMEEHTEEAKKEEQDSHFAIRVAVWASLIANLILCALQLYAAISSVSLSLIATGIDATFDFGSNLFLYYMHKRALKMDVNKWPVGGARLETIGNIIYGEATPFPR
ncbi:hypothetical protein ID866_4955 [Astraeus odoratus]|nr:hypothetical protein ID866_4955 [Astraeus odoratus]